MPAIYVVGVGMTPFGRQPQRTLKDLTAAALEEALADADISPKAIQGALFANCVQGYMEGQHMVRGQMALRSAGLEGIPMMNVENACASGSTAFYLACKLIEAGALDIVLAVGAEKMFSEDKAKMFGAFESAWDVHEVESVRDQVLKLGKGIDVPSSWRLDRPYSAFMEVYAAFARLHMRLYGTTPHQFAAVAAKNHRHSVENPRAQYRRPFTVEEVLAAPSVAYPLTVPMCAPVSDGAAAAILCSQRGLERLGFAGRRPVIIRSSVLVTGTTRTADDAANHLTARAARQAYEQAGLGPAEISVAEVHDATAVGEVIQVENLGFCAFGEGGTLAERGVTSLGGRLPVNPSGGLLSKGHPIAATGLGQIFELVSQLRGEVGARQVPGARIAIAENGGGLYGIEEAVACVSILESTSR